MDNKDISEIEIQLNRLAESFQTVLYEEDETFLKNMKKNNLAGDDIARYQFWEWTQGVGLFGFWKLFEHHQNPKYLELMMKYYDKQIATGLPSKNVNTVAPMLALSFLAEYTKKEVYLDICSEWAAWIFESFPRTKEGGFQHITSDTLNDQELWDDTLFMTVLFLANMGRILGEQKYIDEAIYQFLIHIKYLTDKKTGLWYHGWTFNGNHNFVEALWGRGNCWITSAIPEFLAIVDCPNAIQRYLEATLTVQIEALTKYQDPTGMWHTLINDPTSYVEASATCGFAYGILRAVNMGIIDEVYRAHAIKALEPIMNCITPEGKVTQVSYGTAMGRETIEFYKQIEIKTMPYGQALAILFFLEALK